MSHIHIPDGILPIWLWLSALLITILYLAGIGLYIKKNPNTNKIALVGVFAALMIISMSIEIVPIAYHIKLSVLTGIILGPIFSVLTIFIVNVLLALVGHGGITIVGLNTIIVSIEAIIGYFGFKTLHKKIKNVFITTFIVSFIALMVATFANIGIIYLGTGSINTLMNHDHHHHGTKEKDNDHNIKHDETEKMASETHEEHEHHLHEANSEEINSKNHLTEEHTETENTEKTPNFDIKKFMLFVIGLSIIGWLLESLVTAFIVNYINKVKPDLLEKN